MHTPQQTMGAMHTDGVLTDSLDLTRCCAYAQTRVLVSHPKTRSDTDPSPFPPNRISNTKYTLLTFIPLNLWQQCSQHMNRYFLLIAFLQLWSAITPVAPITTWGPLIVIFAISGLKEAVDDTRRYRADQLANERSVSVLRDGAWRECKSEELLVGDIVRVSEDEEIPADFVLLKSAENEAGSAYIQTSNLDGETNLKSRVTASLDEMQSLTDEELANLQVTIECAHPNSEVYKFDSTLEVPTDWMWHSCDLSAPSALARASYSAGSRGRRFPLSSDNLLLQGTYLRNTAWVLGIVVYTGNETKMGQNKALPRPKYTKLDEAINKITLLVFAFQLSMIVVWGAVGSIMERKHMHAADEETQEAESNNNAWYLGYDISSSSFVSGLLGPVIIPLRFLLLASMMIPISLKVSLDLVKLFYAKLIDWDDCLVGEDGITHAKAVNTSIAENLGQVRYVLSDKTGTMTCNLMVFRKMCAAPLGSLLTPSLASHADTVLTH